MDNRNSNNRNYNHTNSTNNNHRINSNSGNNTGRDISSHSSSNRNISSHSNNVTKKKVSKSAFIRKLKIKRAIAIFLCLIFMITGLGTISYYRIISSMKYNNLETQATDPTGATLDNSSGNEDDSTGGIKILSDS